jgi:hypothetical protein
MGAFTVFMSLPGDQLIRFALYRRFRYKKSNKKFLISLYFIVSGIGQNNACVNIFVMKFHYLGQNLQINMNAPKYTEKNPYLGERMS